MSDMTEWISARAVTFDSSRPGRFRLREFEIPATAGPNEALLRLRLAGVCGSDLHVFQRQADPKVVIPGHEMVGRVVSVGADFVDANGEPLAVGDRVVPESTLPCLRCPTCRGFGSGYDKLVDYTACENYKLWGAVPLDDPVWLSGAYAEYLQVPRNGLLHRIDQDVTDEEAVLLEPLSVAVKAVRKAGVTIGDTVLIEGPGPIGLCCVVAARESGASDIIVTGVRGDESRLSLAKDLGATGTINAVEGDPHQRFLALTGGRRADRVIDTSGAMPAFKMGLELTARNGVYMPIGGYRKGTKLPVPHEYCHRKKIDIRFSHNGTNCYQPAYRIIRSKRYPLQKMVTDHYPLEQAQTALESLIARDRGQIKVVLDC